MLHIGDHIFVFRNGGDAAASCGGQACGGAGEADNVLQLLFRQGFGSLAGLKQLPDCAAAENVACAGGVDDFDTA